MVKFELKKNSENRMSFVLKDVSPGYSNALRRIMLTEVPVMATEDIEIRKNNSALYDEIIASRLGLTALTTDLETYELPSSQQDVDERKAKCTVQLTLKEKGPKVVYASDLKTADPKIKPVYPKTPIVKLLKDQELELTCVAVLGKGKDHIKWSPCHVWYNYYPTIKVNKKAELGKYKEMYPEGIFNKKGEIDESLILENNLVDAVYNINEDLIKVDFNEKEHIFSMESWGQLPNKEIITKALDILDDKLDELNKFIK